MANAFSASDCMSSVTFKFTTWQALGDAPWYRQFYMILCSFVGFPDCVLYLINRRWDWVSLDWKVDDGKNIFRTNQASHESQRGE